MNYRMISKSSTLKYVNYGLTFYMLTGGMFCMFFLFYTFEDVCFFQLLTIKIIKSCVTWATEKVLLFCFLFPYYLVV